MALNIDVKFEGKLTCTFKNDKSNLANFHQSTFKSLKIWTFIGSFSPKWKMYELKNYRRFMCHDNEEWCKNSSELDLSIQNWHEEFDDFSPKHLKISKICTLNGCFLPKYMMFELKKVQRSYFWLNWRLMRNLKENWLVLSRMTWRIWQIFTRACSKV